MVMTNWMMDIVHFRDDCKSQNETTAGISKIKSQIKTSDNPLDLLLAAGVPRSEIEKLLNKHLANQASLVDLKKDNKIKDELNDNVQATAKLA